MKVANPSRASHGKFAASVLDGGVSITINANAKPSQPEPTPTSTSSAPSSSSSAAAASRLIHSNHPQTPSTARISTANAAQRAEQHALNLLFVNDNLAYQPLTSVLRRDPFCIPRASDPVNTAYRPVYNPLSILEKEEQLLPSHLKLDLSEAPPSGSSSSKTSSPTTTDEDDSKCSKNQTSSHDDKQSPNSQSTEVVSATSSGPTATCHENLLMGTLPRSSTCNLMALNCLDSTPPSRPNDNEAVLKPSEFQFLTIEKENWTNPSQQQQQPQQQPQQQQEPVVLTPSVWTSNTATFGQVMDTSDYKDPSSSSTTTSSTNLTNPSTPETLTKYLPTKSPRSQIATASFADPCSRTVLSVNNEQFQHFLMSNNDSGSSISMSTIPVPMVSADVHMSTMAATPMQMHGQCLSPNQTMGSPMMDCSMGGGAMASMTTVESSCLPLKGCQASPQGKHHGPNGSGKRPRARANFRPCRAPGCNKGARGKSGLCQKHGGGKRCAVDGCPKGAQGSSNHCLFHGGGYRCTVEGCTTGARGTSGLCAKHGGYKRRKEQGETDPISAM